MSVFFATPMYGGKCDAEYFLSCLRLKEILHLHDIDHTWMVLDNESLITRGRDICAATFLYETHYDYLMFIDADIGFSPDDFGLVWSLREKADVIASMYCMKKTTSRYGAWIDGKLVLEDDLPAEPFPCDYAGTGFMLIARETLKKTADLMPKVEDRPHTKTPAWFQDYIDPDLQYRLSEDYFFCKTVREAGGTVLMTPNRTLKHVGRHIFA